MEETLSQEGEINSIPPTSEQLQEIIVNGDPPIPGSAQNPTSTGSDGPDSEGESGSDSDSEDDAQQNLQLQTLEAELSSNPSNYEAHVQYIRLLRKMGGIEKLRLAREAVSELFPLTPTMWREWAKDEASIDSGPEAVHAIEKLYERGVLDYLSVSLWCDYLSFVLKSDEMVCDCSSADISKARNLFESALTAAGLHVAEGIKLWEAYREFEQAIFQTIDPSDIQAKEKQIQRIRTLFHRQLSVPLVNMRSTLQAYRAWEMEQRNDLAVESSDLDGVASHIVSAYQRALEGYNARVHLEEQILRQDMPESEKLQQYMIYLKFERSSGDPARAQVLYERAIADFPISSDLWLDYTRYLDKTFKGGNIVREVYCRATKNCPWVGELWVRYLLCLERGHASEKELATVFGKTLQCTFSTIDEYLDLFLTRVDGLRRRLSFTAEVEDVLNYSLIRETFQNASDYLLQHLKNTNGLVHLHGYWARLELSLGTDLVSARGVWEGLLRICGSMLEAWQGYIAMEIELGHINEARSLYKRCYSKRFPGTGSEDICHSWLRFERQFGTLEDFDHAVQKVTPRLEELQLFRLQQESKSIVERENPLKKNAREKRKPGSDLIQEQSPAKRQKDAAQTSKKLYGKDKAQDSNLVEPNKVKEINAKVENENSKNEQQMKDAMTGKTKVYKDQCTAFISNINLKANCEDLHNFFSDVGGVHDIRILHDKFTGKSRGLAYVDFSDDAHLAAAVAKSKQMLLGKRLSIARSNPRKSRKDLSGHDSQMEHVDAADHHIGGSALNAPVETSKEASRAPQSANRRRGNVNIEIMGKNTFAVPRNVKPLGWSANKQETEGDGKPKSNDEFRKMFIKN
ncbi:squamous cell carcinoma antigen recognized by T-cells 3-like isoform X1 [Juglans regia]|uniref:Squamous cell carcinoma antigen recognized by T-cells 3-like isoform X1 n=2 Tax=Juglans regia TaxID=51240 RepID=A0A6P9DYK4_JUGRE|nr:squamous cell carcinoma antigen recognized by T-cells 3-like isoform X1 [Juglans regia]